MFEEIDSFSLSSIADTGIFVKENPKCRPRAGFTLFIATRAWYTTKTVSYEFINIILRSLFTMETNTHEEHNQVASPSTHEVVESARGEKASKTISVKTAIVIAIVVIICALAFYYKGLFVAATIDGSPVSRFSVISEVERTDGKQALEGIVVKKLLNNEAKKQGVTVSSDEVAAEIKKIEEEIKAQGGTLDEVLSSQGMTRRDMEEQIILQKKLEKLLADKIQVTDEEIATLISENKVVIPKGEEEKFKEQVRGQIRNQKLNDAAATLIDSLRAQASIRYFVNYQ